MCAHAMRGAAGGLVLACMPGGQRFLCILYRYTGLCTLFSSELAAPSYVRVTEWRLGLGSKKGDREREEPQIGDEEEREREEE